MNTDITKCKGENCPLKDKCIRYITPSKELRQSYFIKEPFFIENNVLKCDYYYEYRNK